MSQVSKYALFHVHKFILTKPSRTLPRRCRRVQNNVGRHRMPGHELSLAVTWLTRPSLLHKWLLASSLLVNQPPASIDTEAITSGEASGIHVHSMHVHVTHTQHACHVHIHGQWRHARAPCVTSCNVASRPAKLGTCKQNDRSRAYSSVNKLDTAEVGREAATLELTDRNLLEYQ